MSSDESGSDPRPTVVEGDEGGRQMALDQVDNLLDALEWVFQQASRDDREYLLSRGFRSVFRNDGAFRARERRKIYSTAFNTMFPFLSVLNSGKREAPELLRALGPKAPPSFEVAISVIVEGMKASGAPGEEKISDLAPFFSSFFARFVSGSRPPVGGRRLESSPQRPVPDARSLEEQIYGTVIPWLREHRSSISEEAWTRVFLAAATEVDEGRKPQRLFEKALSMAKRRS